MWKWLKTGLASFIALLMLGSGVVWGLDATDDVDDVFDFGRGCAVALFSVEESIEGRAHVRIATINGDVYYAGGTYRGFGWGVDRAPQITADVLAYCLGGYAGDYTLVQDGADYIPFSGEVVIGFGYKNPSLSVGWTTYGVGDTTTIEDPTPNNAPTGTGVPSDVTVEEDVQR